jgi:hypothetical protein
MFPRLVGKSFWEPTMMGTPKREFAAIALAVMKNSVALGKYAQGMSGLLKEIQNAEARWT